MRHYSAIIKEAREEADISIRSLAKQLDMSEGHLRYIERADRPTKPSTLHRIAVQLRIDDKPLMESWLQENMPSVDYSDLASRLPKGIDVEQLVDMYQIEDAKRIFQEADRITASQVKSMKAKDFFKVRTALYNCLGFIRELESTK